MHDDRPTFADALAAFRASAAAWMFEEQQDRIERAREADMQREADAAQPTPEDRT